MNPISKKQISIILVLVAAFLIESPLKIIIHSILSFSQPLAYLLTSIIFYVALFICFLIVLGPNITSKSVIKSVCLAFGFFVFEQIVSVFLFDEIIALIYEIIRPLIIFAVILLGNNLIFKCKLGFNKLVWIILGVVFVFGALFNILEYIRIITVIQTVGNEFFSYLTRLTPLNSVYDILIKLCTYIFTLLLFIHNKDFNNIQN